MFVRKKGLAFNLQTQRKTQMKKFKVSITSTTHQELTVEAEDEDAAVKAVEEGGSCWETLKDVGFDWDIDDIEEIKCQNLK